MAADKVTVNGNGYEWGSIVIKILGDTYSGVKGLKYSQKRERVKGYGTGKHHAPRSRTRGKYSAEGSITMFRASAEDLRTALANAGDGLNYGETQFTIVAQFIEADETPCTVELFGCVIAGEDESHEESSDPLVEEITLDVMYIKKNGRTLFDNSDGSR